MAERRTSSRQGFAEVRASEDSRSPVASQAMFDVVVNKNSLSVKMLGPALAKRLQDGWTLAHIFEQDGNTVMVFQRDTPTDQLLAEQRRTNQLLEWLGGILAGRPA